MSDRHLHSIRVTIEQADRLSSELVGEGNDLPAIMAGRSALEATKASEPQDAENVPVEKHLTDPQFIEYGAGALNAAETQKVEDHLRVCARCTDEIERMQNLSPLWQEERRIEQLERRIRSLMRPHGDVSPRTAFLPALQEEIRAFLRGIAPPRGAYAEGREDCSEPVEFPITEQGLSIDALRGALQRKNDAYYVRVHAPLPEDKIRFDDRKVQITLSEAGKAEPILQRTIDVGVTVLLGAALPLNDSCYIVAQLLPSSERPESTNDARSSDAE